MMPALRYLRAGLRLPHPKTAQEACMKLEVGLANLKAMAEK